MPLAQQLPLHWHCYGSSVTVLGWMRANDCVLTNSSCRLPAAAARNSARTLSESHPNPHCREVHYRGGFVTADEPRTPCKPGDASTTSAQ